ncbi:MAG: Lrp/AsnC family transcriptional regulator [Halioglobus sp.]
MSIKLDRIDRKLLDLLQRNARISNADLAEHVNLSPTPCLRRLRKLESEGWIQHYTAVLDDKKLGFHIGAMVFVKLEKNTRQNGEIFERALLDLPEVIECCVVAGVHDYVLRVVSKSLEDYERLLKEDIAAVDVVSDLESLIILDENIKRRELPLC